MTYEGMALSDMEMLNVMSVARETGALVMVHAENYDAIRFLTDRLERAGKTAPHFHGTSRPIPVEREATHRAISLAELVDVPIMIVHVSNGEAMEEIRRAQQRGLKIYGETCPQYLVLTEKDMEGLNMEGAKYVCSPPPRDEASQQACWDGLQQGVFSLFSSDHCPFRYDDPQGKLNPKGRTSFRWVPNGIPGVETRLPILFSEGVKKGRISLNEFVALHGDQPRQDLRALSEEGHDRGRLGCRHRDLGPGAQGDDLAEAAAPRLRLHALRGHRGDRLAGVDHGARQVRGARRQAHRREGRRRLRAAREVALRGAERKIGDGVFAGRVKPRSTDALGPRGRCSDLWRRHGRHVRRLVSPRSKASTFSSARRPIRSAARRRPPPARCGFPEAIRPMRDGVPDKIDEARRFLEAEIGPRAEAVREAFLEAGPAALDYLEARTRGEVRRAADAPGLSLEPAGPRARRPRARAAAVRRAAARQGFRPRAAADRAVHGARRHDGRQSSTFRICSSRSRRSRTSSRHRSCCCGTRPTACVSSAARGW